MYPVLHLERVYPCFHSISFPSEWGHKLYFQRKSSSKRCFHSISFPSEWGPYIQGALVLGNFDSFHSISFPSEWGLQSRLTDRGVRIEGSFHSISFPSEWGPFEEYVQNNKASKGFHSISFPSEWGQAIEENEGLTQLEVSAFPFN